MRNQIYTPKTNQILTGSEYSHPVRPSVARHDLLRNLRSDCFHLTRFGYKSNTLAASGRQTLWPDASNFTVMIEADTFTITYNNSTDGAGTTGALTLFIFYIDENLDLQTAFHTLGNTGSDVTAFNGLGINRIVVFSAGSARANTNEIKALATTATTVQAVIPALKSVTQTSPFHCPRLCSPIFELVELTSGRLSGGQNPKINIYLMAYSRVTNVLYEIREYQIDTSAQVEISPPGAVPLSGQDVFWYEVDVDLDATKITFEYDIFCYYN